MPYTTRTHGQRFHYLAFHKYTNWDATTGGDLNYGEIETITDYVADDGPIFDKFAFAAHYLEDNADKHAKPFPYSQDWAFFDADSLFNSWEANMNIVNVHPGDGITWRAYQHDNRSQIRFGYNARKPRTWIPGTVNIIPAGSGGAYTKRELAVLVMDNDSANREIAVDLYGVREHYDLREGDGFAASHVAFQGDNLSAEDFTAPCYYRFDVGTEYHHVLYYFRRKPDAGTTTNIIILKAIQDKTVADLEWNPNWIREIAPAQYTPYALATNDPLHEGSSTDAANNVNIRAATCVWSGAGPNRTDMNFVLLMSHENDDGNTEYYVKEWGFGLAPWRMPPNTLHRRWNVGQGDMQVGLHACYDLHYDHDTEKLYILEEADATGGTRQNRIYLHWPLHEFAPNDTTSQRTLTFNGHRDVPHQWGQMMSITSTDDSIVLAAPYGPVNKGSADRHARLSHVVVLSKGELAANRPANNNNGWTLMPQLMEDRSFACNRTRAGRITSITSFGDHAIMSHHDNELLPVQENNQRATYSRSYRRIIDPADLSENSTASMLTRQGQNVISSVVNTVLRTGDTEALVKRQASGRSPPVGADDVDHQHR